MSGEIEPSDLCTACAYKGVASYFSVRVGDSVLENLAWTYLEPRHDAAGVRDCPNGPIWLRRE